MLLCPACGASIHSPGLFSKFPIIRQPDTPHKKCRRCGFDLPDVTAPDVNHANISG